MEWSHDLLSADEQAVFARMAVFRGGCTVETAELIADADLDHLQSLVDKSLLRHTEERFTMLETVWQYAWEQLNLRGELPERRRRHALGTLEVCEELVRHRDQDLAEDFDIVNHRLATERDNIRAALEWARDNDKPEILLRLAAIGANIWPDSTYIHEAEYWYALSLKSSQTPAAARMSVLTGMAEVCVWRDDFMRAEDYIDAWLRTAEKTGDANEASRALNMRGTVAGFQGDYERARADFTTVLEQVHAGGFKHRVPGVLANLADVEWHAGNYEAALKISNQAIESGGPVTYALAVAWENGGLSNLGLQDYRSAIKYFAKAIELFAKNEAKHQVASSLCGLAEALQALGDSRHAAQLLGAAETLADGITQVFENKKQAQAQTETMRVARVTLGQEAFDAEWAKGESLDLDDTLGLVAVLVAQHDRPHRPTLPDSP